MKRWMAAILAVVLASCGGNEANVPNSDTAVVAWTERVRLPGDRIFFGNWDAHIEYSAADKDSAMLVITGLMEPEKPGAKVILMKETKKKNIPDDELVLNLSKRPRKSLRNPVTVSYSEYLEDVAQYKKICILYRHDTVAVIRNIADVKK